MNYVTKSIKTEKLVLKVKKTNKLYIYSSVR